YSRAAAEVLAGLGGRARPALPVLRCLAGSAQLGDRTAAACALARITGDAASVAPVLRAAWAENFCTRPVIAVHLAAPGASAVPLRDLAEAELAARRRHAALTDGCGSHDIADDARLPRGCRRVVAAD
ncbi:hypothetical protein OQI_11565, partial [Streptomyces pharetrae CZA14]